LIIVYKTPSPFSLPLVHIGQVSLQKCAIDLVMGPCDMVRSLLILIHQKQGEAITGGGDGGKLAAFLFPIK
jgi:hypothetical protein